MGFLITIGTLVLLVILNAIFPSFFSNIFNLIFSNNIVCIVILSFAIIGAILIFAGIWRQISSGVNSFGSGRKDRGK